MCSADIWFGSTIWEVMWSARSSHGRGDFGFVMVSMVNADPDHPADGVVCDSLAGQATRGSATKEPGSLIHSSLPPIPDDRVTAQIQGQLFRSRLTSLVFCGR